MIDAIARFIRPDTLVGVVTFYDPAAKAGIIQGESREFYFAEFVVTKGEPADGAPVLYDTSRPGMAHGIVVNPSWWDKLFPPAPDGLDAHYFYSSKEPISESILSRSEYLKRILSSS